ncbi:hypothetical protein C8Q77DRAFT_727973 [Trametes polyzona]|nr:hypothetical protein C8Q77DRAFT_727973 [Trametes polyzona]
MDCNLGQLSAPLHATSGEATLADTGVPILREPQHHAAGFTLETLDTDVMCCILEEVVLLPGNRGASLKPLSLTSRRIRSLCMPFLFRTCWGHCSSIGIVPPTAIRPYVKQILFALAFYNLEELGSSKAIHPPLPLIDPFRENRPVFGKEFEYFPSIRSVIFEHAKGGVPWAALERCLSHPQLETLSFKQHATWICAPPIPHSPLASACRLTSFHYIPWEWRGYEGFDWKMDMQRIYSLESTYLHAIVPGLSSIAKHLTLPVETAPLREMVAADWPNMNTLSLLGRYLNTEQSRTMPLLLDRMQNLRSLSVLTVQFEDDPRPVLTTDSFNGSGLQSLTIAYPNPHDPIFRSLSENLTSLSLRDSLPRRYFVLHHHLDKKLHQASPLPSSSECLTMLQAFSAPRLDTLELVYAPDDAEYELLGHIARAFPLLETLELHRYSGLKPDEPPDPFYVRTYI